MANTVTLRKIIDGPRHMVVHCSLEADGTGEFSAVTLVDPNGSGNGDPVPVLGAGTHFVLDEIWYNLNGFYGLLQFDATTATHLWDINTTEAGHLDFRAFGGIKDASGVGATGKILFTSVGVSATVGHGTLILKLRKE
ncbi:MAG: hypothetical protein ACYC9R_06415 [Nitrosotalea sp.]